jgi:hypothetical protein
MLNSRSTDIKRKQVYKRDCVCFCVLVCVKWSGAASFMSVFRKTDILKI